jgi:hypothetical protein
MKDVLVGDDVLPLWVFAARGALLTLTIGLAVGAMAELASSALSWTGREMTALAVSALNAICATVFYTYVSDAYAAALSNTVYIGNLVNIGANYHNIIGDVRSCYPHRGLECNTYGQR